MIYNIKTVGRCGWIDGLLGNGKVNRASPDPERPSGNPFLVLFTFLIFQERLISDLLTTSKSASGFQIDGEWNLIV